MGSIFQSAMQEGKWLTDIAQSEAVFSFPFFDEVLEEPITKETTGDKAMFRKPPIVGLAVLIAACVPNSHRSASA